MKQPPFTPVATPAGGTEFFPFHHANLLDRDLSSKSLSNEYFGSLDASFRDLRKGAATKKPGKWGKAWNIWGFIQRRSSSRAGANVVERSLSESWPGLSVRHSSLEINGQSKRRKDYVLERNQSARLVTCFYKQQAEDSHLLETTIWTISGY
ncbi:hypothetical protein OPV22_016009 [Ensete ventricosum]|uniref:DUF4005 domain-containing protein n=1 Tax=Ensete ventricosum TaxID=4639 RepID=A0AAV8PN89_ENSVE|nr:hypothetical protein OPV22_016009 [Ensete ventricosum]